MQDTVALAFAEVLKTNDTVSVLNLERNDFREPGLIALAQALATNAALVELRLSQQKTSVSARVEEALASVLEDGNTTLCKLGLDLRDTNARSRVNKALFRNTDMQRQRRLAQSCRGQATTASLPAAPTELTGRDARIESADCAHAPTTPVKGQGRARAATSVSAVTDMSAIKGGAAAGTAAGPASPSDVTLTVANGDAGGERKRPAKRSFLASLFCCCGSGAVPDVDEAEAAEAAPHGSPLSLTPSPIKPQRPLPNFAPPSDAAVAAFAAFAEGKEASEVIAHLAKTLGAVGVDPEDPGASPLALLSEALKSRLPHRLQQFFATLRQRAALPQYGEGAPCDALSVLIVGAGPVGLRTAIELTLLGARVTVTESRARFSRLNVLHLWDWVE
eukprot:6682846-Prymnesium_polylepis.1